MKINVLAFGIAREIMGAGSIQAIVDDQATVGDLKAELEKQYPRLAKLASYFVAVNNEYAGLADVLTEHDEIAIIPPVSGG